jgi:gamma-glutamyltranspeptidase
MTVKNGGNTIDAVEAFVLCVSHCISRACGLAGGSFLINRNAYYSIPVSNEILNSLIHS